MKRPNLEEIKAYVDKHFVMREEVLIPPQMPAEYYLIDNIPVNKKEFENMDGATTILYSKSSSISHISQMTYSQIMDKFDNVLSDQEKETLKDLTRPQYTGPGIMEQLNNPNKILLTKEQFDEKIKTFFGDEIPNKF